MFGIVFLQASVLALVFLRYQTRDKTVFLCGLLQYFARDCAFISSTLLWYLDRAAAFLAVDCFAYACFEGNLFSFWI